MIADVAVTGPAASSAVTGKVNVPVIVPLDSVSVNGTVTIPVVVLMFVSEPLALYVPLTAAAPPRLRVAGPLMEALVPDIVTGALVTVKVKLTLAA